MNMDIFDTTWILGNRLAPITNSIGFLEGSLSEVVDDFTSWRKRIMDINVKYLRIKTDEIRDNSFEQTLLHLCPLNYGAANKFIFIPTNSNWVAYFDNCYRGTDGAAISYYPKLSKKRSVEITLKRYSQKMVENRWIGSPGCLGFTLHHYEEGEARCKRRVYLEHDMGKWTFEQFGNPIEGEYIDNYQQKYKAKRFSAGDLVTVLKFLGIDILAEDFFLPAPGRRSVMITETYTYSHKIRKLSLTEAKRQNSIDE
jgi:hypothetical protein